jgi:hypothetical protein
MAELADPLEPEGDARFAAELRHGKVYYEQLRECGHIQEALNTLKLLDEKQLFALALYVAAEAVAEKVEAAENRMEPWVQWWQDIDTVDPDDRPDVEMSPRILWRIMRPPDFGPGPAA